MAEAEKCKKELTKMMKDPNNKHCVDCGSYPASWTSTNLGVFLCLNCSGIHRGLGVHISFVKSATLDTWNMKLITKFRSINDNCGGNVGINKYYEATMPKIQKINDNSKQLDVAKFIHLKYVKKIWYKSNIKKLKKTKRKSYKKTKRASHRHNNNNIPTIKESKPAPNTTVPVISNNNHPDPDPDPVVSNYKPPPPFKKKMSFLSNNQLDNFYQHSQDIPPDDTDNDNDIFDVLDIMNDGNDNDNDKQNDNDNNQTQSSWVGFNNDQNSSNNMDNNDNNNVQSSWVGFNNDNVPNVPNGATGANSKSDILSKYHQNSNIQQQQMFQMQRMQQLQQIQQQQMLQMQQMQRIKQMADANNNNQWVDFNDNNPKNNIMARYHTNNQNNNNNYYNMNMNNNINNVNMISNNNMMMNNNRPISAHW